MADIQAKVMDLMTNVDTLIDEKLFQNQKYPQAGAIGKKLKDSGIRPSWVVGGVIAAFVLIVLMISGAAALCNLIGFVYPLYTSFKALETESGVDDTQWLTYWIVYGFFTLVESFTDFLGNWIPVYQLVKILFLVWCMLPQTQGAKIIYEKLIKPFFKHAEKHSKKLSSADTSKIAEELKEEANQRAQEAELTQRKHESEKDA